MGINSTEVAYQFGQLGSVYTTASSDPIRPPVGKVFVAVTMLDNTVFDDAQGLVADVPVSSVDQYIGTEAASHATADITVTGSGGTATEGARFIDTTGTPAASLIGKSLFLKSSGAFLAKVKAVGFAANGDADASTLEMDTDVTVANSAVLQVADGDEGAGGLIIGGSAEGDAVTFPKGVTIYGRWTEIDVYSGKVIAYIGD